MRARSLRKNAELRSFRGRHRYRTRFRTRRRVVDRRIHPSRGFAGGWKLSKPSSRSRKFQQIVCGADQGPLSRHIFQSTAKELTKLAGHFDLPEHRLHDLLSKSVSTPVPSLPYPLPHLPRSSSGLWRRSSAFFVALVVSPSRDVAANVSATHFFQIRF